MGMVLGAIASLKVTHSIVLDDPLIHSVPTKMMVIRCRLWNQSVSYDTEGEKQCQQT